MTELRTLPAHFTQFQAPTQAAALRALVRWLERQDTVSDTAPSILALTLDADAEGESLTVFWEE